MQVDDRLVTIENSLDHASLPLLMIPAAIPYFRLNIEAICIERRELGIIKEFILRAISSGISSLVDISGVLGLPSEQISLDLKELEFYYYVAQDENEQYRLLEKGDQVLSEKGVVRPIIKDIDVYMHGIFRQIQGHPRNYIHPVKLPRYTLVIPATPIRPPNENELDLSQVNEAISNLRTALPQLYDVSRLGRILNRRRMFTEATVLVPRDQSSKTLVYADGIIDYDISDRLSNTDFFKSLSTSVSTAQKATHRKLRTACPRLEDLPLMGSDIIAPLLHLVAKCSGLKSADKQGLRKKLQHETEKALSKNYWIGQLEAQILFHIALLTTKEKLVIKTSSWPIPHFSNCAIEQLERLTHLHKMIEFWIPKRLYAADKDKYFERFRVHIIDDEVQTCGFLWDESYAVMGCMQTLKVKENTAEVFLGAVYPNKDALEIFHKTP